MEKENERDKESEDSFLNLTVEQLMQINISQKIIDMLHQYTLTFSTPTSTSTTTTTTTTTTTSTSIPTTSHHRALCVSLYTSKGFSHLMNARYEMLDSNYPVLSPQESTVRDHLKAYVQSYSNENKR